MKEAVYVDWIDGSDPGQPAPAARGGGIPAGARGRPSHAGDSDPRAGEWRRALAADLCFLQVLVTMDCVSSKYDRVSCNGRKKLSNVKL
jgi:hypothetical protein